MENGVAEAEVSEHVDASCHEDVEEDNVDPLSMSDMSAEKTEGLQSLICFTDCMEEDRQTCQEMQEMVHSWGVVKWDQFRRENKSFNEFSEECDDCCSNEIPHKKFWS